MPDQFDIVLVMCPPFGPESPPLALATLAAAARGAGFAVCVRDLNIRLFRAAGPDHSGEWDMSHKTQWVWPTKIAETYARFAEHLDAYVAELAGIDSDTYGFSVHSDNRLMTQKIIRRLKATKPGARAVVGGMGVYADSSMRIFEQGIVDAFAVGPEGEQTLIDILGAIRDGRSMRGIPGVRALEGALYTDLVPRIPAANLDVFPWPTFEDFDLAQYTTPNLPVVTSRGCSGHCVFCNDRVLMGMFRGRTAASLFAEIKHHVETLGVHDFSVNDLQINYNILEIDGLCNMIASSGMELRWTANAIVSDALKPSILKNLRAAGCTTLTLGLESGSQEIVKIMSKGYGMETARRLMNDIKQAGIKLWANIVIGFPGETDATVQETIDFLDREGRYIDEVCVCNTCNILEYSILHRQAAKFGIAAPENPDWYEVSWRTEDGVNTPAVRREWLGRVLELLKIKNIPVRQTNYFFQGEDSFWNGRHLDVVLAVLPPYDTSSPPRELVEASAYLESRGLAAACLDLNIEAFRAAGEKDRDFWSLGQREAWANPEICLERMRAVGLDAAKLASRILARKADAAAFYVHRGNIQVTKAVLEILRGLDPSKKIILFGPSTSITAERDLFTDAICDFMILGEIEASLADLLERIAVGENLGTLRGVRFTKPDGHKHFIPREPIRGLDAMPPPDYRELRPKDYGPVLQIRASRGCRYRCAFCMQQPFEGPARYRTARSVYEEMAGAYHKFDTRAFEFSDLVANGSPAMLDELCGLLAESKLPIRFGAYFAPSAEMTPELFRKLAVAGCTFLRFGVESFSDRVLRLMNKDYTAALAVKNLKDAREAGIETHVHLIVGFPGETYEDFYTTARWLRQAQGFIDFVDTINPCKVLPRSAIERNSMKYTVLMPAGGGHSSEWSHKGYNNENWRKARTVELAVWIAGLDIKFNYDFFAPKHHPIRRKEERIRARMAAKIDAEAQCLIVNLPPWGFTNPPVGPAVLATYLDSRGYPAKILDFNASWHQEAPEEWKLLWHVENKNYWSNDTTWEVLRHGLGARIDKAVEEIVAHNASVVGFSVVDPKERIAIEMIRRLRAADKRVKIVIGGPATFTPEYRAIFFERAGDCIDGCVVGEGEEALLEIMHRATSGAPDLKGIPGVITMGEGGQLFYAPRPPIADLDSVPFPTYRHFDLTKYHGDSLVMEWSRGCVADCAYCKGKDLAGPYRSRSAEHIFDEIKHHVENLGITSFTIADNILNGRPKTLERLCDLIIESSLQIRWNAEAAPMRTLTRALLDKLHAAGCFELQLGLECGSDRVLGMMNKARLFSVESAERVVRDAHEAGIKTCMFCIVGFPGETEKDFRLTLDLIERNAAWIDQVKSINSCHIITGTDLHRRAGELGITLPEVDYHYLWTDENGMDIAERNSRIRRVLALVQRLGIECLETNLAEGKQYDLAAAVRTGGMTKDDQFRSLIAQVNKLGSFDAGHLERPSAAAKGIFNTEGTEETESTEEKSCLINKSPVHSPDSEIENRPRSERGKIENILEPDFVEKNLALAGILTGERVYAGPRILEIDLTNRCNLHCAGCWNHGFEMGPDRWTGENFKRTLPAKLALDAINAAAAAGARMVQLSGAGEPLLHPDFLQIVERVKARGLKCAVITNGTLLDEKVMRRLVDLGLDDLTVSVWAGTPEMYEAVHPKTKGATIHAIRDALRLLHQIKRGAKKSRPHVKIYNVISRVNASGIDDMISFALKSLADYVEFTPLDIVKGKSDHLALTARDRELIRTQLDGLTRRDDYLELDPAQAPRSAANTGEGKEFARFVKYDAVPFDFKYELDDIRRFDVLCERKSWRLDVTEDNQEENALLFQYPKEECAACPLLSKCSIDKERFLVKVEFLSVLGFGAFYRRITSREADTGGYDAEAVRNLPCNIGWTYARIGTDGRVAPCCKAKKMPMGNLKDADLLSIWSSPAYADFRKKAMTLPKDDPYFAPIACTQACDNLGMILAALEEIRSLSDGQKKALEDPENSGFGEI